MPIRGRRRRLKQPRGDRLDGEKKFYLAVRSRMGGRKRVRGGRVNGREIGE